MPVAAAATSSTAKHTIQDDALPHCSTMDASKGPKKTRRSHTKSKNGCATCKRRHIRCDETFPQCRNCTKHGVECDHIQKVNAMTLQSSRDGQWSALPTAHSSPSSMSSEFFQPDVSVQSFADYTQSETGNTMYGYCETVGQRDSFTPQYAVYQPYWQGYQMDTTSHSQLPLSAGLYSQHSSNGECFDMLSTLHSAQSYPMSHELGGHSMHYWAGTPS